MIFYKETNFKETPIGKIPKDWEVARLTNDLIEVETGKRAKGGALNSGNIASIGGEHIDDQGNVLWDDMKFIPDDFYNLLKQGKVKLGDILLVKDGATTGKVAMIRELKYRKVAVNEHVFIIRSKTKLTNDFLFYFLFSKFGQIQIRTRFHGLIGGIIRNDLDTVLMPLPPLSEQCKIAEVLSTVDETIRRTDKVIAKTERLKKGLMQTLLTRGIGHKEYKQTSIGTIPKEWQIVRIGDVTLQVIDSPHKIPKKANFGMPFVSVNYMLKFPDYNFFIDETIKEIEYISDEDSQEFLKRFNPEKGDILYSKWGTPGIAKLINTERKFIGSCSVALIKTKKGVIDSLYLVYALNSQNVQRQIVPHSKTSTRTEIHIGHIKRIKIPLPPLEEQKKIVEALSTIDKRLTVEKNEKLKLERIKQGLMDLLLTGKIRVKTS